MGQGEASRTNLDGMDELGKGPIFLLHSLNGRLILYIKLRCETLPGVAGKVEVSIMCAFVCNG